MAVDLLKPVLSDRTRSINFFNGRLLAGEDLTTEQQANRVAHNLLGQAIGDGVVYGLEVKESAQSSTIQAPVLAVTQGLALSRNGTSLLLDQDAEVRLVRPADAAAPAGTAVIFQDCAPTQVGVYIAGAGVYLLTIGPASTPQGLAEVSGVSTSKAPCNSKYNTQGVQFRLMSIELTQAELSDVDHLRNLVAYKCFGVEDQDTFVSDPFGRPLTRYGLLDQLRSNQTLTDCEVPLAVLYWSASSGLVFVDMWAVRRRPTHRAVTNSWPLLIGDRRASEAEAMFLQFESQIRSILLQGDAGSIAAETRFQFLPPAGILPVATESSPAGFNPQIFFGTHASMDVATTDGDLVRDLFQDALSHEPIELADAGKVQLYLIWENLNAAKNGATQLGMIFASAALQYRGRARFGWGRWSLSRFAPRVI
jgi:hypothetical protein